MALGDGSIASAEDSAEDSACFALELSELPPDLAPLVVGNALSYLGTSMLLDFRFDLAAAAAGGKPPGGGGGGGVEEEAEPNGIEVRRVASGPGDYLARVCLRAGEGGLPPLEEFYSGLLGMRVVASDSDLLCLRYGGGGGGAATTLVFEAGTGTGPDMGNCLNHLVIAIGSVDEAMAWVEEAGAADAVFQRPTAAGVGGELFGDRRAMGVADPSGYRIYLAEL